MSDARSPRPSHRLAVVSGYYPGRRLDSHINHSAYCRRHGIPFLDASYPTGDRRPHFRKLEVILDYLPHFDWLFWLDDDAYFTDFSTPLWAHLAGSKAEDFIACKSPSTKKVFTKFSSGQFFIKNSARSRDFLEAALRVDLHEIRTGFWRDDLGLFTGGEQDALVFLTETDPRFGEGFYRLVDHNCFNNRDFEYTSSLSEHFLVHFTGEDKEKSKTEFSRRLVSNCALLPPEEYSRLNLVGHRRTEKILLRAALVRLIPARLRAYLRGL